MGFYYRKELLSLLAQDGMTRDDRPMSNLFKQALREKRVQIGFWQGLGSAYSAEICAGLALFSTPL